VQAVERLKLQLFDLQLPEGRCIGLLLSDVDLSHADALKPEGIAHAKHWIHDTLHPQEVSFGVAQPSHHARTSFFLGRLAMQEALRSMDVRPFRMDIWVLLVTRVQPEWH